MAETSRNRASPPIARMRRASLGGRKMQPEKAAMGQPFVPPNDEAARERQLLEELVRLVGQSTYERWFCGNAQVEISADRVTIGVTNPFLLSWMQHEFRAAATEAAQRVLGPSTTVCFATRRPADTAGAPVAAAPHAPKGHAPRQTGGGESKQTAAALPNAKPAEVVPPVSPGPVAGPAKSDSNSPAVVSASSPLPGRRFADLTDFIKGPGSELAMTAAHCVCEQPGPQYNPLVLYGGVGTGKTHLLEGIYRRMRQRHPSLHVLFISAEAFANCFTQALRDDTLPSFRQRFRNVGALIVDDIDFLEGKRVTQEEFLHTIKQLESHDRQIVLSVDRNPRLLTKLREDLVTRFISGIVCRIEPPDTETRRTIVARKAARLTTRLSGEILDYVAERFGPSVRELEGALNCLETYAIMSGGTVSLAAARRVLTDLHRDCVRIVRIADVEETVCHAFGVEGGDLRSARRSRSVSQPRMLAMYLARKMTQAAYGEIGEYFGGRNHSTVMSAEKRVREMLASEATVRVSAQTWKLGDLMSSLEQQLLVG